MNRLSLGLLSLLFCDLMIGNLQAKKLPAQAQTNEKFNQNLGVTEYFSSGKRSFSIISTAEGYYPEKLTAFVGEELSLFFTNTQKRPNCMVIPEKNVFLAAARGSISESKVTFDAPGKFVFYCPSHSGQGEITILPRTDLEAEKKKRSIASVNEEDSGPWIPRDE